MINLQKVEAGEKFSRTNDMYRTADFFAGVGGVRLGFEKAGFETVFSNDFDPYCKVTFDFNSKNIKQTCADIRTLSARKIPEFDILAGGFPCQAFSVAGYRQGFRDGQGRGNLFFELARIIEEAKSPPRAVFLENVKNLLGHDNGKTYKVVKQTLELLGYHVTEAVLNSMDYGNVPQTRERIFIVGFLSPDAFANFDWPQKVKLTKCFRDLLQTGKIPDKYYYNGKPLYAKLRKDVTKESTVYQWRRKYVRENKKGVCPTLTANMGTGGHNVPIILDGSGIRKFTPRECFQLQAFPPRFKLPEMADSRLYKQAGNSVTVSVIHRIATNIKSALDGRSLKNPLDLDLFQHAVRFNA